MCEVCNVWVCVCVGVLVVLRGKRRIVFTVSLAKLDMLLSGNFPLTFIFFERQRYSRSSCFCADIPT